VKLRAILPAALAASLALPAAALGDAALDAARGLDADPVYVHPAAIAQLPPPAQGRVRLQIVNSAIGRIEVVVVPARVAREAGGIAGFAQAVDREFDLHGAMVVVAGADFHVITSHGRVEEALAAVRRSVAAYPDGPLWKLLVDAVKRLGKADPGPDADSGRPGDETSVDLPDAGGFLDDVGDTFRLVGLIVAGAIALPFLLFAIAMVIRFARGRSRAKEVHRHGERTVRDDLVALGDGIRALDLDTSMPDADRAALADYEQAIARYDQANALLEGEPSDYEMEQARAAIDAGRRHIEASQRRLV
jgi:hypothetical protein